MWAGWRSSEASSFADSDDDGAQEPLRAIVLPSAGAAADWWGCVPNPEWHPSPGPGASAGSPTAAVAPVSAAVWLAVASRDDAAGSDEEPLQAEGEGEEEEEAGAMTYAAASTSAGTAPRDGSAARGRRLSLDAALGRKLARAGTLDDAVRPRGITASDTHSSSCTQSPTAATATATTGAASLTAEDSLRGTKRRRPSGVVTQLLRRQRRAHGTESPRSAPQGRPRHVVVNGAAAATAAEWATAVLSEQPANERAAAAAAAETAAWAGRTSPRRAPWTAAFGEELDVLRRCTVLAEEEAIARRDRRQRRVEQVRSCVCVHALVGVIAAASECGADRLRATASYILCRGSGCGSAP